MQLPITGTIIQILEKIISYYKIVPGNAQYEPQSVCFCKNGTYIFCQAKPAKSYSPYCSTKSLQTQGFQPHFFQLNHKKSARNQRSGGAARRLAPPSSHLMNLSSSRMTSRTSMGLATWAFMPQSMLRFTSSAKASAVMAIMGRSRSSRSSVRIAWVAS